ncbi:hypothetical protein IJ541_10830, partial [bacterium]|nr:hypothetical protein [bacterium]
MDLVKLKIKNFDRGKFDGRLLTFHSNPLTKSCYSEEQIQDGECAAIQKKLCNSDWIASSDLRPPRNDGYRHLEPAGRKI